MFFDRRSIAERFWSKVARGAEDECWLWLESCDEDGYGQFWVRAGELDVPLDAATSQGAKGKMRRAHRVAFFLVHGHWPRPIALHGCDNTRCCNAVSSEHVHEGTHSQNSRECHDRGRGPDRMRSGERHYNAKLTDAQVEEIRRHYAGGGVTQAALAVRYGVTQRSVSRYVRGERYAEGLS